jgi:hypothetical protein
MEEANKVVNNTIKTLDPMASVIVGTVTGSVDTLLRHLTMVQKLSMLLQEAEMANKDLLDKLAKQSMDVETFKQDKQDEIQRETGLSVVEAEDLAIKEADKYWVEKYGDSIGFVQLDNRDCFNFEREMAAGHMPFVMMPVHAQDYTSIYMVSGDNMEQIMDIAAKFESQSLFMDADKANDLMNDSFVRQMENLSYPQMQQVQLILAEKGIASRIREDPNKNLFLVSEKDIGSPEKEKIFNEAVGVVALQKTTKLYKAMEQVQAVNMKAFEPISRIMDGEKVKGITIYDSAHPENYIVLRTGGAIVYKNQEIEKELNFANPECVKELQDTFHFYVCPASTEGRIQEFSLRELAKPYVSLSIIEQMNGIQKDYMEHLFENGDLKLHMEPDSKRKPYMEIRNMENDSLTEYNGNSSYMAGIIEAGRYRVMEEVGILNITDDSDNTVTALTNNIEMDSSNMQGFVDKVRTDLSSVSLTSQMYEMEVPAVDEGRADITIEDREQDVDYGNGDYGSRFNDDPDYDINRPIKEEPDIEESPVMDDIEDFDLSDEF